jgi:hypothetical protein
MVEATCVCVGGGDLDSPAVSNSKSVQCILQAHVCMERMTTALQKTSVRYSTRNDRNAYAPQN